MCTEFFLAFIYFITIFGVNYFIFKLLKNNLENIFFLYKIERLFKLFPLQKKKLFHYLIELEKKIKPISFLSFSHNFLKSEDILIIGQTYKFLLVQLQSFRSLESKVEKNIEQIQIEQEKKKFFSNKNKIYLTLLVSQYLTEK
jgi:hypothetical protein